MTIEQIRRKRTFDCPTCKTPFAIAVPPRYHADEFCPECDYPMFWAPEVEAAILEPEPTAGSGEIGSRPAVTDTSATTKPCPACGYGNVPAASYCSDCGIPFAVVTDADATGDGTREPGWWDGTWGRLATAVLIIALLAAIAWTVLQLTT